MTAATPPTVSCVIPVYNGQAYLAEAIDSLLGQDYSALEVVVVDDGSTDGTAGVIARYGRRIVALHQDNAGVSVARNRGVAAAGGELLCFLDADDRALPGRVAAAVAAFSNDPTLDLVGLSGFFWTPEFREADRQADPRFHAPFWREQLPAYIGTWMLRRPLWGRVGGFKPGMRFSEDTDWFSRARDAGMRRRTLDTLMVERRLHRHNVTAGDFKAQGEGLAAALFDHLQRRRGGSAA